MYGNTEDDSHERACEAIRASADAHERAKADKERSRLDFLEATGTRYVYAVDGTWFFRPSEDAKPIRMSSARAAIDAACATQAAPAAASTKESA